MEALWCSFLSTKYSGAVRCHTFSISLSDCLLTEFVSRKDGRWMLNGWKARANPAGSFDWFDQTFEGQHWIDFEFFWGFRKALINNADNTIGDADKSILERRINKDILTQRIWSTSSIIRQETQSLLKQSLHPTAEASDTRKTSQVYTYYVECGSEHAVTQQKKDSTKDHQ